MKDIALLLKSLSIDTSAIDMKKSIEAILDDMGFGDGCEVVVQRTVVHLRASGPLKSELFLRKNEIFKRIQESDLKTVVSKVV